MTTIVLMLVLLVAAGGAGVVLTRDPLRQAMASGFFALTLALLFLVLQAPDVAISEIVVGVVVVPLMVVLALAKAEEFGRRHRQAEGARDEEAMAEDPGPDDGGGKG